MESEAEAEVEVKVCVWEPLAASSTTLRVVENLKRRTCNSKAMSLEGAHGGLKASFKRAQISLIQLKLYKLSGMEVQQFESLSRPFELAGLLFHLSSLWPLAGRA